MLVLFCTGMPNMSENYYNACFGTISALSETGSAQDG